jgi:hypothetical protein
MTSTNAYRKLERYKHSQAGRETYRQQARRFDITNRKKGHSGTLEISREVYRWLEAAWASGGNRNE